MRKMKLFLLSVLTLGLFSIPRISYSEWVPYSDRYAVIVMGANASGQRYLWYWGDTGGMYRQLMDLGFDAENVFFLSYGDSTDAHPEMVDKISTKSNVEWAFNEIQKLSGQDDLVYVYWVSHGNRNSWQCHDKSMLFADYENLIRNIDAKIFIGAYNPCYSGAVIPHISRNRLISVTSVNASELNSYGWAGKWRAALRGGSVSNLSDKNEDGYISMAEAYEWEASYSLAAGEHPLIDDNGDGMGGLYGTDEYDHTHTNFMKDGYVSSMYALNGYYIAAEGVRIWSDCSWCSNGDIINFPQPFGGAPVIVTSAHSGDSGEAQISSAVDNAPDKFRLLLYDHNGNSTSGYVQVIAVGEDTLSNIDDFSFWTERAWHGYGEYLHFSPTFASEPVIVTSAQANGIAKMACAVDNASNNCWLAINDHNGNPSSGWVQSVAVAPGKSDGTLTIWRECAWYSNGDIISFSPSFENNPVIITSAQSGGVAEMSSAVDNAPDGFRLSLYDHNGNPTSGWVQIIAVGKIHSTSIEEQEVKGPEKSILSQNFPNPFNSSTTIEFCLPSAEKTIIKVFDILGHEIVTLLEQDLFPGKYRVSWNGKDTLGKQVSSGVYFYKIQANEFIATAKMVLLR